MNFTETLKFARLNVMVERGYKYSPMGKVGNINCRESGSPPARRPGFFMRGVCTLIAFKRTVLSPKNRREEIKRSAEKNKVRIYVGNICGLAGKNQAGCENLSDLKRVLDKLLVIRNGGDVGKNEFMEELNSSIRQMCQMDREMVRPILQEIILRKNLGDYIGDDHIKILKDISLSMIVRGQTPAKYSGKSIVNDERQIKPVPASSSSELSGGNDATLAASLSMESDPEEIDSFDSDSWVPDRSRSVSTGELSTQPPQENSNAVGMKSKQVLQIPTKKLTGIFEPENLRALPNLDDLEAQLLPNENKKPFYQEFANSQHNGDR